MLHKHLSDTSSPLTPIPPMSYANFNFSPAAIARYFATNKSLQPKPTGRRSFSPNPGDLDPKVSSPSISPILCDSLTVPPTPPAPPNNTPTNFVASTSRRHLQTKSIGKTLESLKTITISDEYGDTLAIHETSLNRTPNSDSIVSLGDLCLNDSNNKSDRTDVDLDNSSYAVGKLKSFLNQTISVDSILTSLGLSCYAKIFISEEIDLEVLLTMTDEELLQIGIADTVHRKWILNVINQL